MKVTHEIPPLVNKNSRVLVLGSFPSPASRNEGFYYMHPKNRFWKVLAAVFNKSEPISKEERADFALSLGIAIWDVISHCEVAGAADSAIKDALPNDFSKIHETADIRAVFTTGKLAAKLYKKFTGRDSIVLPSTSPANCAVPFEKLVENYSEIRKILEKE